MPEPELLRFLEEVLRLPQNTLAGGENLRYLAGWDSLSTLNVIAMVDRKFGKPLPGSLVARCQTVDELIRLIDGARRAA